MFLTADWSAIGSLITSIGFPIMACVAMALYVKYITDRQREDIKELNMNHIEEMMTFKDEIKNALNNNTIALTRLCEKIDKG